MSRNSADLVLGLLSGSSPRSRILCILIVAVSLNRKLDGQAPPDSDVSPPQQNSANERPLSVKGLAKNTLSDQKRICLFPVQARRAKQLLPAFAVIAATAALIRTDARTGGYFRRTDSFHGLNSALTDSVTAAAIGLAPASLYVAGCTGKDAYARNTALLAAEAVADAAILTIVIKDIDRRKKPADYPPDATLSKSWFNGQGNYLAGVGSFPSGHTAVAFSVATVLSRRYPRHRWVPYAAYGLSSLIGFSRMTLSAHFPSDAFMGAALGYSIGRFAVLRR